MKRIIDFAKKLLSLAAIITTFSVALVSCSYSIENKENTDSPYLCINIANNERTVLPDSSIDISSLSNFELTCFDENQDEEVFSDTYESYTDFQNIKTSNLAESINHSIVILLNASKIITVSDDESYELKYSGMGRIENLSFGENQVTIELALEDLGEGNGNLNYTLDYSQNPNAANITKISYNFTNLENNDASFGDFCVDDELPADYKLKFNYSDETALNAGSWKADFTFYTSENNSYIEIGYWQEVIQIATGLTSTATRTIQLLPMYKVTYNYNYGEEPETATDLITSADYDIRSVNERSGYTFLGWFYKDEKGNFTEPFSLPVEADVTVYAYWLSNSDTSVITENNVCDTIEALAETYGAESENPATKENPVEVTITVFGPMSDTHQIADALRNLYKENPNILVTIDLSKSVGLENVGGFGKIEEYNIEPCLNLKGIKLPKSIISIESEAFTGCELLSGSFEIGENINEINPKAFSETNISQFIVSDKNNYLKSIDGSVYSHGGKCLELGVPSATEISIGVDVESINQDIPIFCKNLRAINVSPLNEYYSSSDGVLYDKESTSLIAYPQGKSASSFTIPSSVICLMPFAFYNTKLTTINFEKQNYWYDSEPFENEEEVALAGTLVDVSKPSENVSILSNTSAYIVYSSKNKESVITTVTQTAVEIPANQIGISEDLDVNNYTVVTFEDEYELYYKFTATQGKKYTVNWVDSCSYDDIGYKNYPSELSDCYIFVYDSNFNWKNKNDYDDPTRVEFTAESSGSCYLRIKFRDSAKAGKKCAFRVWTPSTQKPYVKL